MPLRQCVACKKAGEKDTFIRFVIYEGKPLPDIKGKLPGRGFNVCPDRKCFQIFAKKILKNRINPDDLIKETAEQLKNYLLSLTSIAHRSGITIIGQDNIKKIKPEKGTLFISKDLSRKTARNLKKYGTTVLDSIFSGKEIGNALKKDAEIGVLFIKPDGIGKKIENTAVKLNKLLRQTLQD
ncbi:YlxR family protein [Desulfurobacterium sp.]